MAEKFLQILSSSKGRAYAFADGGFCPWDLWILSGAKPQLRPEGWFKGKDSVWVTDPLNSPWCQHAKFLLRTYPATNTTTILGTPTPHYKGFVLPPAHLQMRLPLPFFKLFNTPYFPRLPWPNPALLSRAIFPCDDLIFKLDLGFSPDWLDKPPYPDTIPEFLLPTAQAMTIESVYSGDGVAAMELFLRTMFTELRLFASLQRSKPLPLRQLQLEHGIRLYPAKLLDNYLKSLSK